MLTDTGALLTQNFNKCLCGIRVELKITEITPYFQRKHPFPNTSC